MHDALAELLSPLDPAAGADTFVVVPTRAAGEQLRRTVEDRLLPLQPVLCWPHVGPRADLYRELASRALTSAAPLSAFDREVLVGRIAREAAAAGTPPPFALRPALIAEMLSLYDHIRRQARTVADFERNLRAELEPAADTDRGAAQLLVQTVFLAAVFTEYERETSRAGLLDEHGLRSALERGSARPLRRVVVAVGDRVADPDGLWPVDFALLSTVPDLVRIDIVSTEAQLASGYLERIHAALPGLEETTDAGAGFRGPEGLTSPRLVVRDADAPVNTARDREDELAAVARRVKAARRGSDATLLSRQALIVRRPLPYLYLARSVFGASGLPFETLDTLPLAAEPYAAALDLVLDFAASGFSRSALIGLLRSPHFRFDELDRNLNDRAISALDRVLSDARYLGGLDRLKALADEWARPDLEGGRQAQRQKQAEPALAVAVALATDLSPLTARRPVLLQLEVLHTFLGRYDRDIAGIGVERTRRVRRAVLGAIGALSRAHAAFDPGADATGLELSSTLRRWLGAQTFAVRTGEAGVRLLDSQAARFADVDDAQLLGVVEGEWPEPPRRNIFYPPFLLGVLDPSPAAADPNRRESAQIAAARASFLDLLMLPRQRVRVSGFALENDAVIEPSPFADDVASSGLSREIEAEGPHDAVFMDEALLAVPPVLDALSPVTRTWAVLRQDAILEGDRRYLGEAGAWVLPRVSASRIDRYLKCPFQFFASDVLALEEEPEDGDLPPPWERGRFLHAIFETFFREWQSAGRGSITADRVEEARERLVAICERALEPLASHEAALERVRLYGSAVSAGIIDRVLSLEAERPAPVERRLIEFELDAPFSFRQPGGSGTREVRLRAKVDRVDLIDGGGFRVIDYKSRIVPDPKRSVQLQVYTSAVAQQLARGGDARNPSEAFYLSLEGDSAVRALRPPKGETLDTLLRDAEERMIGAIDAMRGGHFPAQPTPRSLCAQCPFDRVCRKAFVEPDDA